VGLPNEAPPEESEPPEGRVRNKCPSPNRKRPSTCLAETGQMTASTRKRRGKATDSCRLVEIDDCVLDEEDPCPSSVTRSAAIGSDIFEEAVKKEATPESGQMAATRTNRRGEATLSRSSSVEEDGGAGRDEEDSKPSAVTSNARIGSSPGEEVVLEQATSLAEIPLGWVHVKLEPDC
jgi:hypothetical protein